MRSESVTYITSSYYGNAGHCGASLSEYMQVLNVHEQLHVHIQHLHAVAQARPTMSCIPLVARSYVTDSLRITII